MDTAYLIGLIAAVMLTASGVPQVFYMFITKNTSDVSLAFILMLLSGQFLMMSHLLMSNTLTIPLCINYAVSFMVTSLMLFAKLKYK